MVKSKQSNEDDMSDKFKNKSTLMDSLLGRVKTDEFDNYYENIQTKVSNDLSKHKKFYHVIKKLYSIYANITGPFHILPDFVVIGPGHCGTTSMVELYLRSNPNILPSKNKEIFYFDINYKKSINWYKLFFPTIFTKIFRRLRGKKTLTCEATPNYFFHPYAPKNMKKIIPNVKIVLMLRNPVNRTISNYRSQVRMGRQKLTFEKALERESELYEQEYAKFLKNKDLAKDVDTTISYVARSRYVEALERFLEHFDKKQILFMNSDEYFKNPIKEYNRILSFLGLPSHEPKITGNRGISPPGLYKDPEISQTTKDSLKKYFEPWNKRLFDLIDEKFDWD